VGPVWVRVTGRRLEALGCPAQPCRRGARIRSAPSLYSRSTTRLTPRPKAGCEPVRHPTDTVHATYTGGGYTRMSLQKSCVGIKYQRARAHGQTASSALWALSLRGARQHKPTLYMPCQYRNAHARALSRASEHAQSCSKFRRPLGAPSPFASLAHTPSAGTRRANRSPPLLWRPRSGMMFAPIVDRPGRVLDGVRVGTFRK